MDKPTRLASSFRRAVLKTAAAVFRLRHWRAKPDLLGQPLSTADRISRASMTYGTTCLFVRCKPKSGVGGKAPIERPDFSVDPERKSARRALSPTPILYSVMLMTQFLS